TTVGFLHLPPFQSLPMSSGHSASSQSITMRSVLPFPNNSNAVEALKQMLIEMDSSRRIRPRVLNRPPSRETNKHSNAISEVIDNPVRKYRHSHNTYWFNGSSA